MATKPSNAAEKALQKVQEQITCGICLEFYKQPKLLKCFHVFCEKCLQPLVDGGRQSLICPHCRQETLLPVAGVAGLQGAFYIHYLFDIQDALQKVSSSDQPMCNTCKKRDAVRFCRTCGFVCLFCVEAHQYWDTLSCHDIIDLETLTGDVTTFVPPLRKMLFCLKHPSKEADLYCEDCDELICRDCIVRVHREHQYDLVPESYAKQESEFIQSVKPVEEQITMLIRAVELVDAECAIVVEQKTAVVAEIHTSLTNVQQALEVRKTELVSIAEQLAKQKLKTLTAQRDMLDLQIAHRKSCQDFVEDSRRTCSQGEILRMKSPLVKQIEDLTGSLKAETMALSEQADLKYLRSLDELLTICQQFGMVYCHPVCPENCRASGKGTMVATRGETVPICVEVLDSKGKVCLRPVNSLRCELVSNDGSNRAKGTLKRQDENKYDITYQPQHIGQHQLHILIEQHPIVNSPFTVTILPNLTVPTNIIEDVNEPWGIAARGGGEMVVAECNGHNVSMISANREKKAFGTHGTAHGQFSCPAGVAIDAEGNMLVVGYNNHRIQQFSSTGKHIKTVGTEGSGFLQFLYPVGIEAHSHTHKVYVADTDNHRIQVLNSDLTYSSSFGGKGSENGKFVYPCDISTDGTGNMYVADRGNHRIQVFTVQGEYLRQFGKKGEEEGELDQPISVAVDSRNIVYVGELGNNRISIFSSDGKFIKSCGKRGNGDGQFNGPYGISLDRKGTVYVSDTNNKRIQIFS